MKNSRERPEKSAKHVFDIPIQTRKVFSNNKFFKSIYISRPLTGIKTTSAPFLGDNSCYILVLRFVPAVVSTYVEETLNLT
jgi:hypothetical protein